MKTGPAGRPHVCAKLDACPSALRLRLAHEPHSHEVWVSLRWLPVGWAQEQVGRSGSPGRASLRMWAAVLFKARCFGTLSCLSGTGLQSWGSWCEVQTLPPQAEALGFEFPQSCGSLRGGGIYGAIVPQPPLPALGLLLFAEGKGVAQRKFFSIFFRGSFSIFSGRFCLKEEVSPGSNSVTVLNLKSLIERNNELPGNFKRFSGILWSG